MREILGCKKVKIFFSVIIFMMAITMGCIDQPETEILPTPIPLSPESFSTPVPIVSITPVPTDISVDEFIDKYMEAIEIYFYDSYEPEVNANESENLAFEYYDSDEFNKASGEFHKASELYLIARDMNLESEKLFTKVYEIAPTENYRELCTLYISASQSDVKRMGYMGSIMEHMENACGYYERKVYIAGDKEIEKAEREAILYNIETEISNEVRGKLYEMDVR